jgi:transcriptional regulator with XRE-family HTH domain
MSRSDITSGVSRSMVSQIERGTSSPTVATLWNLTQALGVDFAGLLDTGQSGEAIEVLSAAATPAIESQGSGCRIRILSPPEAAGDHEVYELDFAAGGSLVSEPHGAGAREHLTVISGSVTVQSGEAVRELSAGDTARYSADQPHAIRAGDAPARAFLIVQHNG